VVARIVQRWRKIKFLSDKDQRRLTCALQNIRMSCNSTYLLDQETDHGVKADELAALFDELFAEPKAKAVVFSQWTRTHEIVIRRLEARRLGYVSFHGGGGPRAESDARLPQPCARARVPPAPYGPCGVGWAARFARSGMGSMFTGFRSRQSAQVTPGRVRSRGQGAPESRVGGIKLPPRRDRPRSQ
jgi:hypothetical protein